MLSAVTPAMIECVPQELFPIMPPSVQRECVAGSGPKVSLCSSAASRSWSQITPGSTRARRSSGSRETISFRYFEKSIRTALLTVWPARPVPQPRPKTGAPCSRQTATISTTSSSVRGMTTPVGTWRYAEPSFAYSARLPSLKRTSPATRPASSRASVCASTPASGALVAVATETARDLLGNPAGHAVRAGCERRLVDHVPADRQGDALSVLLAAEERLGEQLRLLGCHRRRMRRLVRVDNALDQHRSLPLECVLQLG